VGVPVRFATVAQGTTQPAFTLFDHRDPSTGSCNSIRESDSVSCTRSSIVHRLRRVPAHLANIDLPARTVLSPSAAEHNSQQTLCPPNHPLLDIIDTLVPPNAMPSDHPQTPQSPCTASFTAADLPRKQSTSPRVSHSLPTPAHSINGSMSSNSDISMEAAILQDALHAEISNKRKRDVEDNGDRDQKKVHVEDSRASIDDLHLDVGEKYLLCRTRKAPSSTRSTFSPLVLYSRGLYYSSPLHIIYRSIWLTRTLMRSAPSSLSRPQTRSLFYVCS
jgi:hypothetical protein